MEHEVFVPVPAERLRETLADPARVARAVPGLQQDAGTPPVAGRLKMRVGGHTITYRGALRIASQEDGSFAVEGDATEARGGGSVKLALTLRLRPAQDGTTLAFDGTATADGRVAELPPETVTSATTRLLTRFAENVATTAVTTTTATTASPEAEAEAEVEAPEAAGSEATPGPEPVSEAEPAPQTGAEPQAEPAPRAEAEAEAPASPSASPEDLGDEEDDLVAEGFVGEGEPPADGFVGESGPPAEAAHARRTMIGRSAEEVDHAPPRGRYAPVPAPETATAGATLRWAAPAAALVVASAIVVGRVLRRRR
ncbi:SRPBCC domain-containing protein [Streptomyces avermitilis]|uniref:SRPBCC domain-containing protein n=1 Tax=Streptomyces avermitilis TaxID=33903 RepID=UPI0033B25595